MYLTRKKKLGRSEELDEVAMACGEVWTDTVTWFWRFVRRQDVWLSKYDMCKWICTQKINGTNSPLGSKPSRKLIAQNTAQNVVREFYSSLQSWRERRGSGERERPPYKPKKFYKANWNYTQLKLKEIDGVQYLRLSRGRGPNPILIEWPHPEPKRVEIGFDGEQYELRCQYEIEPEIEPKGKKTAGVDLGEIHLAVTFDGEETLIFNGRELRSKRNYQNKIKGRFAKMLSRCKKGSRRWTKLVKSKNKQLKAIQGQIDDIIHKHTTTLVNRLYENGVSTIVIGDVRSIRADIDYGKKSNQKLHQWVAGKTRQLIEYKAKLRGMQTELETEEYSSQTCLDCNARHKPRGRNYQCPSCGAEFHRDQVGAYNIRRKYLDGGSLPSPVVGVRTTPSGESQCSSLPAERKTPTGAASVEGENPESDDTLTLAFPEGIRYDPHMDCGRSLSLDAIMA